MIIFLGPLPPPLHGFSAINSKMLELIEARSPTMVFNRSRSTSRFGIHELQLFIRFVGSIFGTKSKSLYMGLSGGWGQLLDAPFVAIALAFKIRIFVHHHSFAYLNSPTFLSRIIMFALRKSDHIVLCSVMADSLVDSYKINSSHIHVLSNAAFLETTSVSDSRCRAPGTPLTIGFLSNITAEKGIFTFFETLQSLRDNRVLFNAVIAGPVSIEIQRQFDEQLAMASDVRHVGSVYDAAKTEFFADLDLLLFPTQYANEAEPVTLWEAMASGVPIVTLQRGCIKTMVPVGAGVVVAEVAEFARTVVAEVRALHHDPVHLLKRREAAKVAFEQARKQSALALDLLLANITDSVRPGKST